MDHRKSKQLILQIAVLAGALLAVCLIYRLSLRNTYTAYFTFNQGISESRSPDVAPDKNDIFEIREKSLHDRYMEVRVRPRKPGSTSLEVTDKNGAPMASHRYEVGPFMTVYDRSTGGFTGDKAVLLAVAFFCLGVGFLMLRFFLTTNQETFYSYVTIYAAGFSVFALASGFMLLVIAVRHLADPAAFPMINVYSAINATNFQYIIISAPFLFLFAAAMTVSNIELLRHERRRFQNVLGILVSILLVLGEAAAIYLYTQNASGPEFQGHLRFTAQGVYATVFVYFECMLIGSVICGIRAARHEPAPDKDYAVILGCSFRKDGTLTPLLKGRVDRAIKFAEKQAAETGRELIFIPSGGKGGDETMPEAEAMSRYLLSKGIPESRILREDRSRNTYENMAFSKKLIEKRTPSGSAQPRVIYSTTNYHVFRSGVWASLAGLRAEGIGSRTRWWFWPNAFMRECVGLLQNRWREELALLAVMTAFFATLSVLLG